MIVERKKKNQTSKKLKLQQKSLTKPDGMDRAGIPIIITRRVTTGTSGRIHAMFRITTIRILFHEIFLHRNWELLRKKGETISWILQ